jgi:hypothetical protein
MNNIDVVDERLRAIRRAETSWRAFVSCTSRMRMTTARKLPLSSSTDPQRPPNMPNMPLKYEMAAVKGCWMFSIWVKVEGERVPVFNIISAKEGPEAWIAVPEERVSRY